MKNAAYKIRSSLGSPLIPGVTRLGASYNFTMTAPEDAEVALVLYQRHSAEPILRIPLDETMKTGMVRSVRLEGFSPAAFEYNYEINGRIVQDPQASVVHGRTPFGAPAVTEEHGLRCGVLAEKEDVWEDVAPNLSYEEMILYKVHVRGYTKAYKGRMAHKGTFAALKEMIPYWKELGVNAIELMPAYEFAETLPERVSTGLVNTKEDTERVNFWGYIDGFYLAPKRSYCASKRPEQEVREFVKALHQEGMECIMEFCFSQGTDAAYALRALQWWRLTYHIDGFHVMGDPALLDLILKDGLLSETKILLPGYDFSRLSGRRRIQNRTAAVYEDSFQQDMRRFLKSDEDMVGKVVEDIRRNPREHGQINYLTSQNGFTLQDLVSYNYRHNEANGDNNQDGASYNYSWNCGAEGPTRKQAVKARREQQIRNAYLLMLLSQGTPMLYGGDEFGNTQMGNNNAWCQDNAIGWVSWKDRKRQEPLTRFVKQAIEFRKAHPILHSTESLRGTDYKALGFPDYSLHGERAWYLSYDNSSRMFGILYNEGYTRGVQGVHSHVPEDFLYVAYNFHWETRSFALPTLPPGVCWQKAADTSLSYEKCFAPGDESFEKTIEIPPRSIVILVGKEAAK